MTISSHFYVVRRRVHYEKFMPTTTNFSRHQSLGHQFNPIEKILSSIM